jgi:hypothetical protein
MSDERPPVAIGHVWLKALNVGESTDYYAGLGLRVLERRERFAVLELRGGTHLLLLPSEERIPAGETAPFDLIVDDLEVARKEYEALGLAPSEIQRGKHHDSFTLLDPSGYALTLNSTHASGRPI